MKKVDAYLGRTVLAGSLLALLALTSLDVFINFLDELGSLGKTQEQGVLRALTFAGLELPRRMYEMFPTAVLLGSLLGLGGLAAGSELVAMRAAGMSVARVLRAVLQAGLLLVLLAVAIGELLTPWAEMKAQSLRNVEHLDRLHVGASGLWARDGGRYFNVRIVTPDLRLVGLRIYEFDAGGRLQQAVDADSADYDGTAWTLHGVRRSRLAPEGVQAERVDEERWARLLSPDLFDVVAVAPRQMSAVALARYAAYLRDNGMDAAVYESALWTRFAMPLSTLVMLVLTIPFVFGPLRSGGAGQRLFVGMLVGIGFFLLNRILNHLALVYGLPPLLGASLPMLTFLLVGLWGLGRVR
ncbi:MAG: LPS export ABC transporter permease LptG [Ectothiorhodospiraceae bacterium]|jgi:lipopolysaccharide export system permease protein|nr:LPS export ABC transporter permease LptG [Ectothiorhodospiraceae bacterium]